MFQCLYKFGFHNGNNIRGSGTHVKNITSFVSGSFICIVSILVLIFNTFLYNLCVATFSLNRPVTTCLHNLCVMNLNQDNPIKYKSDYRIIRHSDVNQTFKISLKLCL
jgi:hypothetical protein